MQHRFDMPDECSHNDAGIPQPELRAPEPEADVPPVARLPGIATQLIGERMRSMYAAMVSEAVPEDLLQLVRQLESKERSD